MDNGILIKIIREVVNMLKIILSFLIIVLITVNPLYSNTLYCSTNPTFYDCNNSIREIEMSKKENEQFEQTADYYLQKKRLCNTILGISYGSAMVGTVVGIVSGLFWAFSKKNKTANMAVCLTGSSLFLVGTSAGLITSNVFCKKYEHYSEDKFLNNYSIILNCDFKQKDYLFGLSYKF